MITHLIFSGSNIYGLPFLGVIRYLYTNSLNNHIKYVAGTSFGALMAVIVAIKMDVETYETFFTDFCNDENIKFISSNKTINLLPKCGIETAYKYIENLKKILIEKYDNENLTFLDIAKINGINLYINAFCINTQLEYIFNVDNTPNVSIVDALCASMSLPILFQPVEIDGYYYNDACFVNNTLVSYFSNINENNILSIMMQLPHKIEEFPKNTKLEFFSYSSIILQSCMNTIFKYSSERHINKKNTIIFNEDIGISIKINNKGVYFHINETILNHAILLGYDKTSKFFDTYYQTIGSSTSMSYIGSV